MSVLRKPLVTEKFTRIGEKLNKFSFIVEKKATKDQIKREVEQIYGVNVVGVNTMIYRGKSKTRFTKRGVFAGSKPSFKKAVITLKEEQKIDFFQNI